MAATKTHTKAEVEKLPDCNFCPAPTPARYDGKTGMGPWANMCDVHFEMYGIGLGLGRGQKLVVKKEPKGKKTGRKAKPIADNAPSVSPTQPVADNAVTGPVQPTDRKAQPVADNAVTSPAKVTGRKAKAVPDARQMAFQL